ncbi:MAG: cytochrome c [Winogradskyella sp.]|nr:MAG: cytochrome c [Winogradskyella sp.]
MKTTLKITVVLVMLFTIVSCNKKTRRNYQYMPNMYQPVGYEPYQESDAFKGDMEAQLPVDGTIPRGYSLYEIEDTTEGYEEAKAGLESPLDSSAVDYARGKELYDIYCGICHGNKGDGQGTLMKREKILGVPSYDTRELTAGSIYHVIYYGLNSMGSYANFMSEEERWQVVAYVEKLKADLEK